VGDGTSTDSPLSTMAVRASSMPSDVPEVMSTRSGEVGTPRLAKSAATASRAARMPGDAVYPLWPSRIARATASTK
jgi:hypothetical protein